tara:strand:+ start:141 stop:308 length:168 start_codon:yes stop_codon:yes gene_type:complete
MKPSKLETLIFRKRELASKGLHWENQKRIAEKQLEKIRVETEELKKEITILKGET